MIASYLYFYPLSCINILGKNQGIKTVLFYSTNYISQTLFFYLFHEKYSSILFICLFLVSIFSPSKHVKYYEAQTLFSMGWALSKWGIVMSHLQILENKAFLNQCVEILGSKLFSEFLDNSEANVIY